MSKPFKPMLASPVDFTKLRYPTLVSPKYDGIRAIIRDGVAVSRSLKPIPNNHVQEVLREAQLEGMDGELIVGEPYEKNVYQATNSGVMSKDGQPQFRFYVFDLIPSDPGTDYVRRLDTIVDRVLKLPSDFQDLICVVEQYNAIDEAMVLQIEERYLEKGYEGVMLRDPYGKYKQGRATANSQELLKLKRWEDSEALVIGFECLMHNGNEATINALGHTERSTHKENLTPSDMLGNLIVRDIHTDVEFSIGTGFTQAHRKEIWRDQDSLMGRIVKYKSFAIGVKDKPRFPVFLGWRSVEDLS